MPPSLLSIHSLTVSHGDVTNTYHRVSGHSIACVGRALSPRRQLGGSVGFGGQGDLAVFRGRHEVARGGLWCEVVVVLCSIGARATHVAYTAAC